MKKMIVAIVMVFVFIGIAYYYFFGERIAQQKEIQCDRFHTGEFTYSEKSKVRIVRDATTQTEFNLSDSDAEAFIDKYNIYWKDECTYYLTLASTNRPDGLEFSREDTMWVTIVATKDNIYEYSAFMEGKTFQGSILKLK